jgi:2-polyprenyl-3-methyl-5-hydroxy-6-metoxy-1,4-benzoquinol methylase
MRELVPCCICGASGREVLYPQTRNAGEGGPLNPYSGHYQINVCSGCGLTFSSPIFDEAEVEALYRNYSEANVAEAEIGNVKSTMRGYYQTGRKFIAHRQRALDVGSDIGLLLEVLAEDGFRELHGIEPVTVAREQAKKRVPNAAITASFYEDTEYANDYFDLIALIHVVDHLVHPDRILDRVHRNLRPGGICIAVVHDVKSPLARLTGERFPVFNYFHHYFFSKRTLHALFAARRFEILHVAATRNRYSLGFLIERAPLLPARWRQPLSRLSRRLGFGHISLSLPLGNIGIVARKPSE